MPKRKSKKPSYYNPWHFHHANNSEAATRIARTLSKQGKDTRIKKATKKKGFTVWSRN